MAKLSQFTRNTTALSSGVSVQVGPADDPITITTSGFSPAYADRLWALRRIAAIKYNTGLQDGEPLAKPNDLPPSLEDECTAKALGEKCIQGVSGLQSEDGSEITVEQLRDKLLLPDNIPLLRLALEAVSKAGEQAKTMQAEAEKNSQTP
ncbi:hypothetical protein [Acetobacter sp. LMG 32666]|uniref:hypothetical protein n=1 Tax=Acetobacter sp. LMG 32666 TaxID=2959295 RepID=UPI0030C80DD1